MTRISEKRSPSRPASKTKQEKKRRFARTDYERSGLREGESEESPQRPSQDAEALALATRSDYESGTPPKPAKGLVTVKLPKKKTSS